MFKHMVTFGSLLLCRKISVFIHYWLTLNEDFSVAYTYSINLRRLFLNCEFFLYKVYCIKLSK
uniref:Transmembrane protein n=1 Tax=Medicago truncatula TaxID=3880 RepID=I3SPI1_MEDTR|nr:unknown [Medicago truncatula]